jgi:hypothetical protein
MPRADRDKAFYKQLQIAYTRALDVSRLTFYLVNGVVSA